MVLFAVAFIFACQSGHENKEQLTWEMNLEFYSGFNSGNSQIEQFNGEEYVCFSDFTTNKETVLHNLNKDETYHIDLSNIAQTGEKISAVEVMNLDTILVLTAYTNRLFMINQYGTIWNRIDFNPYLIKEGRFELLRSETPFQYNDTSLIFGLSYAGSSNENEATDYVSFYQEKYAAPKLFKVDNIFNDSLETHFGLFNLYNNFTNKNYRALEGSGFSFLEDHLIFKSAYSDTIYQIDPILLTITNKVQIKSDFGRIYLDPVSIEESLINSQAINENFSSYGQIRSVHYDSVKELFFLMMAHKPEDKEDYPWSIIVMDKAFNQLNEIKMDDKKYAHYGELTSKGLLISNYYETLNDSNHFSKNTYALFNYE